MEMSRTHNEPVAHSAHPARQMPKGDGGVALHRWKVPKGVKPTHPVSAAIAGNEGGRDRSGGRPGHPVQRKRSPREGLVDSGVISGQSKTPGKNHSDGSRRILHGGYLFETIAIWGPKPR